MRQRQAAELRETHKALWALVILCSGATLLIDIALLVNARSLPAVFFAILAGSSLSKGLWEYNRAPG